MGKTPWGQRINEARKDRGLTSDRLAELCHINATYLRQIEGGAKTPSLPVFVDLCNALEVSPAYLLRDVVKGGSYVGCEELEALWKNASPSQTDLLMKMIAAALGGEDA